MVPHDRGARLRKAAAAGIAGPLLFIAVFVAEGALRPGYDPMRQTISELSLGPRGWVQVANFLQLGAALLVYLRGLAEYLAARARVRLLLLYAVALAFFPSALFPTDPPATPLAALSVAGAVHLAAGVAIFVLSTCSMLLFAVAFRRAPEWRGWRAGTALAAAWMAVFLVLFVTSQSPAAPHAAWSGLFQRAVIFAFLIWHVLLALRMLRDAP